MTAYLFGFFINFELDSEFNETIYIRGLNNLTYNNFSEGEKLRVDLALILAWRELSLMQSGSFPIVPEPVLIVGFTHFTKSTTSLVLRKPNVYFTISAF